ncbi:bestrophin-1 domain protein [Dictyocaulus viviparus]|uniref:Bestrophin homolog n=1 Tax=Dictyocaulus viviparus TaxID=29172 RepID=A0A0D8XX04_DICVI|nr:bestrophin-1 domain protein [Dictyocaulus viviparus]
MKPFYRFCETLVDFVVDFVLVQIQVLKVLVFRDLSMRCRKRFPTLDTVAAAGFMMPHEKENFDEIQYNYNKYFLPFNWAWALIYRARKEGFIESDYYVTVLSEEVKKFRTDLAWLCNYDWVPLPMIYPTIVCLAVHTYFLVCVIARQYVEGSSLDKDMIDMVFPFMTSIQFVLYMGWLKVAEALLNPWGEDDDDFETNVLIDRNIAMGLKIVDEGYGRTPELKKDAFWDDEWVPLYSEDSAWEKQYKHQEGSLSHIKLDMWIIVGEKENSMNSLRRYFFFIFRLDKSVSQVRMVPLQSGNHHLRRRFSSFKEKVVPVKPEETTNHSSIGSFIRSASKLSLNNDVRKLSKNFSTPHFFSKSTKESSMKMSNFDSSDVATDAVKDTSFANDSFTTSILNGHSGCSIRDSSLNSGELSRVMTGESSDALQMFAIGDRDPHGEMDTMETKPTMFNVLARGNVQSSEQHHMTRERS